MHSVERGTAIVRIQNDILRSLDTRKHVVMVLLDLSAAFDSVDYDFLLAELNLICLRGVSTSANLGVQLDSNMSVAVHVSHTCRTAYAQLRGIARIRSFLPLSACKTFVHAFITSRLDFGNAALYGITGTLLRRLEMVLPSTARVICLRRRDQHSMTSALQELHWLPVCSQRLLASSTSSNSQRI